MQKKVIALAVAGLVSGAAFAQSNVTVYGVMDAYAGYGTADNAGGNQKQTTIGSGGLSSSRLGFKGEEALGNGLKAIFTLELGSLDITSGGNTSLNANGTKQATSDGQNGITSTRQSYVGLSSAKLGTAYLGRVQTLGYDWAVKYDTMAASNAFSPMGSIGKSVSFLFSASNAYGRQSNAVAYISPNFSGVTVRGNMATGNNASNETTTGTNGAAGYDKSQTYYALGADYDNGPLSVGLGYATIRDLGAAATLAGAATGGTLNGVGSNSIKEWALAGSYDFKVVKPYASYQESKLVMAGSNDVKRKMFNLGVAVPVLANGVVKVAYMNYRDDTNTATIDKIKAQGWALDYEHSLSKRTTAYAGVQGLLNGSNGTFGTGNAVSGGTTSALAPSADKNAYFYGAGVRHTF